MTFLLDTELSQAEEPKGGTKLANRTYEVMYIIDPTLTDEKVTAINESIQGIIEKEGATVVRMDDGGRRDLAYPIEKKTQGYYMLFEIEGSGQEIIELERRMRVNDAIMRYITVRVDEDRKKAEKIRAKRESKMEKRTKFRNTEESAEEEQVGAEA